MPQYPALTPSEGFWLPGDRGFTAWSGDPVTFTSSFNPTNGTVYVTPFKWVGGPISNVWVTGVALQVGGVVGQNFLTINDLVTGNQLATTADITSLLAPVPTVPIALPLTVPVNLGSGIYLASLLLNAATVTFSVHTNGPDTTSAIAGINGKNVARGFNGQTGQTTMPNPVSVAGAASPNARNIWYGFT